MLWHRSRTRHRGRALGVWRAQRSRANSRERALSVRALQFRRRDGSGTEEITILTTPRLRLRPVAAEDHGALHTVFTQPGVRRFIFDNHAIEPQQTSEIIEKSAALFVERGFGLWLAHTRLDETLVGFGGFWFFRDPPELELLYGVADAQVGRGYGREIARTLVDYGFDRLQMSTIRASTDAQHARSRHLLESIGFRFVREAKIEGLDTVFYVAVRAQGREG